MPICFAGQHTGFASFPIWFLAFSSEIPHFGALLASFVHGMIHAKYNLAMKTKPLMLSILSAAVLLYASAPAPVSAQLAVPPTAPEYQPLSDPQLDQLLGPIALYPDPLLGEILPAATLPTQIVLADRYVTSGGDPNQIAQQGWDASVVALTHYPTVLKYLDDNLAWTTAVGEAFLYQQDQVLESIQRLRLSAQNFGNLVSTPQEQVVYDNGDIEILPVSPDVVYIPVYQPIYVYYESGYACTFTYPCAFGVWLNCDFDWVHHCLRHWDPDHHRPPNWWSETPGQRQATLAVQTTAWHPPQHPGKTVGHHDNRPLGNSTTPGYNSQNNNNNAVVGMPRHGAEPRPSATPTPAANPMPVAVQRPAAVRDQTGFQLPSQSAPVVARNESRDSGGSANREVRNYNPPAPQNGQTMRPEPPRVEPPRAEPPRIEPPHVDPPHVEAPRPEPPHVEAPRPEPPHVEPPHSEPPHSQAPAAQPTPPPQSSGGGGGHDSKH
jgi:hypothetical protein